MQALVRSYEINAERRHRTAAPQLRRPSAIPYQRRSGPRLTVERIVTQGIDHGEDSGRERARIVGCDCETMLGGDRRCSRREWGRLQAWGGGGRGGAESRKSYSIV